MKNAKKIMLLILGIALLGSCKKDHADSKKANEVKKSLIGFWKITDAKTDMYNRGILRKDIQATEYLNREFNFTNDSFTEKRNNESTVYRGKWCVYIVDTEDGDGDALEEGEDNSTNVFLFYCNNDGKQIEKTTLTIKLKHGERKIKAKMETQNGIVHLILDKQ